MTPQEQVADCIRELVLSGVFRPGDRLPSERALAERLSVSRGVLRDGLRHLVELGMIETRDRSGIYVSGFELEDLFELRLVLEPMAAALAAERHDAADAKRLRQLLRELRARGRDWQEYLEHDVRLHRAIAEIARNALLFRFLESLADLARFSRELTTRAYMQSHAPEHDLGEVVTHILAREPEAARDAMRRHIERAWETVPRLDADSRGAPRAGR